jgi:hypothetical protein
VRAFKLKKKPIRGLLAPGYMALAFLRQIKELKKIRLED